MRGTDSSRVTRHASRPQLDTSFGRLPLSFEPNVGQTDPQVKFLARGRGYTLFLTQDEAVLVLRSKAQAMGDRQSAIGDATLSHPSPLEGEGQGEGSPPPSVVRMRMEGAKADAQIIGAEKLAGIVNYFIGSDPKKWRTNIPTYKKVEYKEVYPGIDLAYYGNQGKLEYDLIVAPGADPNQIKLAFDGAKDLKLADSGDLILTTETGEIRLQKPLVYQLDNKGHRTLVVGNYVVQPTLFVSSPSQEEDKGEGTRHASRVTRHVGFDVASYDHSKPLVIDPVLFYSTYLGGSGSEEFPAIGVDAGGNAYVTGVTSSTDFPTASPLQATTGGGQDVFVTKLDAAGALVYSTYLGGSGQDDGTGIAADAAGNAYVTGSTDSTNFPTASPLQASRAGSFDAFVTKLDAAGAPVYSTYLGGTGSDGGIEIAVDAGGNAYVTGDTSSSNFPTASPLQASRAGSFDAFVTKLNAAGSTALYSTYLGGSGFDGGVGIAVDAAGNAYVTGGTTSTNFPTVNPFQATPGGGQDVFVTKLNAAGSTVLYSTYLGGSGLDDSRGIAVDGAGNAYVGGSTGSTTNFPTVNPLQPTTAGGTDAFVTKLNVAGSAALFSTYLGGSGSDAGRGIAVDAAGNAYVMGSTGSTNFPTVNPLQATIGGGTDAFVTKLNAAGSAVLYSTYLGGSGTDSFPAIAVDGGGNAYVTGETTSTNFPTVNPLQATMGGIADVFVAKICNDPPPGTTPGTWAPSTPMSARRGHTATLLADGRVLVAGGGGAFALSSAEVYTPPTTWTSTSNTMSIARVGHTATRLSDGRVLVAGGSNRLTGPTSSVDLYDPDTNTWTQAGPMNSPRTSHTATLLPDGRVLVVGGFDGVPLNTAEVYSSASDSWTLLGATMTDARFDHAATLLADGRVLVVGGEGIGGLVWRSTELLSPTLSSWVDGALMTQTRTAFASVRLADGRVLAAGGDAGGGLEGTPLTAAEIYTPNALAGSWSAAPAVGQGISSAAVLLPMGTVLIAGGFMGLDPTLVAVNSATLFDPAAGTVSPTGCMGTARGEHRLTLLANGQVFATGGGPDIIFPSISTGTTELYTPGLCGAAAGPAPAISGLAPASGPVGTAVTITGSNFGATQGTSTVTFNGERATTITTWADTLIIAVVPAGAATGAGDVVVTVGCIPSNGMAFMVTPPGAGGGAFAMTPTSATVPAGTPVFFGAIGGTPPYKFSVVSGVGAIGEDTGVYTTGTTDTGTATVRVTDMNGTGATALATLIVTAAGATPVMVSLDGRVLATHGAFSISGNGLALSVLTTDRVHELNLPPETYTLTAGASSLDFTVGATDCVVTLP